MAQVFGEVGMGLFDLVDKGRHRSVSGVVGGMPRTGFGYSQVKELTMGLR